MALNISASDIAPKEPESISIDFDKLQSLILNATRGNDRSAIGTSSGDLHGVSLKEANIMRSPCAMLKWLDQNTPYHWETFVTMTFDGGWQGITAYNDKGEVAYEVNVPMTGGDDADPMKQIYINNRAIMLESIRYVLSLSGLEGVDE